MGTRDHHRRWRDPRTTPGTITASAPPYRRLGNGTIALTGTTPVMSTGPSPRDRWPQQPAHSSRPVPVTQRPRTLVTLRNHASRHDRAQCGLRAWCSGGRPLFLEDGVADGVQPLAGPVP